MTKKPFKNKLIVCALGGLLLAGEIFILSAPTAQAGLLDFVTDPGRLVYAIIGIIAYAILTFISFLVQISATLLEFVFSIEKFTDVRAVTVGWQICRDLCNLGFIFILLILSFDSIIQTGNYQIKQILPRLIVAALLINFSLMFCGVIIDASQILAHYFYEAAKGTGEAGLSGQLAGALNIASVYKEPIGDWGEKLKAEDGENGSIVANILFGSAVMLVAAFSLAAAAIFFISRIVQLWLLMIFAPIAWMSMIVPNAPLIGVYWGKWWAKFLKWAFFAPVYMFFIYLAVMIAASGPMTFTSSEPSALIQGELMRSISGFLADGFGKLLQYIAIIMILIGGLKYAGEAGAIGAKTAMGLGQQAVNWSKNKIQNSFKRTLYDPVAYRAQIAAQKAAAGTARLASSEYKIPFIDKKFKLPTRWGGRLRAKAAQMEQKGYEFREARDSNKAYAGLLKTMSEADLLTEVNSAGGIRKLIAARAAKEKGLLEKGANIITAPEKPLRKNFTTDAAGNAQYNQAFTVYNQKVQSASEQNQHAVQQDQATVRRALSTFNAYGLKDDKGKTKEAKDLEDTRFDVLEDNKYQQEVIRRAKENGNLDKIKPVVARDERALTAIQNELSPMEFEDIFKKWGKTVKETAKETMVKTFNDNSLKSEDALETKKRNNYASLTGEIGNAFRPQGATDFMPNSPGFIGSPNFIALSKYISNLTADKVAKIEKENDLKLVGQYVRSTDALAKIIRDRNISSNQKEHILNGAKASDNDGVKNFAENTLAQKQSKEQKPANKIIITDST